MKDDYEQDIPVKTVKTHPAFGIGAKNLSTGKIALYAEHDIALMELSRPARIDARTSPVCVDPGLPDFSEGEDCRLLNNVIVKIHKKLIHDSVRIIYS